VTAAVHASRPATAHPRQASGPGGTRWKARN
jgi:hypothetical protein